MRLVIQHSDAFDFDNTTSLLYVAAGQTTAVMHVVT